MSGRHHGAGPPASDPGGRYRLLAVAVEELLVETGVLTAEEIAAQVAEMDRRSPARGARMVARAWCDDAYRTRLLADASAAAEALDIPVDGTPLVAVENTPGVHNLVVCTLCSCYPRAILGLPPDWYKMADYRRRAVREPRKVLAEFGTDIRARRRGAGARFDRRHALSRSARTALRHRGLAARTTSRASSPATA